MRKNEEIMEEFARKGNSNSLMVELLLDIRAALVKK